MLITIKHLIKVEYTCDIYDSKNTNFKQFNQKFSAITSKTYQKLRLYKKCIISSESVTLPC